MSTSEPFSGSEESGASTPEAAPQVAIQGEFGSYSPSPVLKQYKFIEQHAVETKTNEKNALIVKEKLGDRLLNKLYDGIEQYQNLKSKTVEKYIKEYSSLTKAKPESATYFRDELSTYIKTLKIQPYKVQDPDIRTSQPEKATITMEQLLGEKGVALYKLALLEERYSREYVNAVFVDSMVAVPGKQWSGKRPVVIVAGPSGCGKSHAAAAALAQTNNFIPTKEGEPQETNFAVFSDGGKERDLSQIRKIAIQLSTNNGYTGVSDLETKSKVKNKVKTCLYDAVSESKTLGLVIPETFAGKGVEVVNDLQKNPDNVVAFARVEGKNPGIFKEVVAFLGSRRAFKSSGFDEVSKKEISLNITGLPESKAYGSWGFRWGDRGSRNAEATFIASQPDSLSMIITNDLTLKKYEKGIWRNAEQGEPGVVLVSNRVFQQWSKLSESEQLSEGLNKCCGNDEEKIKAWDALSKEEQLNASLGQYNKDHGKTIIHTRGQMDLLILKIQMERQVAYLHHPQNSNPENNLLCAGLEKILETFPKHLSDGEIKIEANEIKKIQETFNVYREDIGERRATSLDSALNRLNSELKISTFKAAPAPVEEATRQQTILADVQYFSDFITEKVKINSVEYKSPIAAAPSRTIINTEKAQEIHYKGYALEHDERIISHMKVKHGIARLEQDKSGSVEDHCSGTLSELERQQVALKQAQMALNNYNPEKGKIVLRGHDVEQSQRLYAAVMYLASNNPELRTQMKSGMFSYDPEQLINCRVLGFKFPGKMERNSEYINRYLPDLQELTKDGINVLSSSDKKKIDLDLKNNNPENLSEKENKPFNVYKDRFKIIVQKSEEEEEELSKTPR